MNWQDLPLTPILLTLNSIIYIVFMLVYWIWSVYIKRILIVDMICADTILKADMRI